MISITKEETRSIYHGQSRSPLRRGQGYTNKSIGGRRKELHSRVSAEAPRISLGVDPYRERPRRDGSVKLNHEQAEIDHKRGVDCESDLRSHPHILLHRETLLIVGVQELVDHLVLARVKFPDLPGLGVRVVRLELRERSVIAAVAAEVEGVCGVEDVSFLYDSLVRSGRRF